jgi:hypothetical protein
MLTNLFKIPYQRERKRERERERKEEDKKVTM